MKPGWRVWGLLVLFFSVMWIGGRLLLAPVESTDDPIAESQAFLRGRASLHAGLEKFQTIAAKHALAARAAADTGAQLSAVEHQRDTSLAMARTAADSNPILLGQRDAARASAAHFERAYALMTLARLADSTRADNAERGLERSGQLLADVTRIADCHMLGWHVLPRCLNRTWSFIGGAGVTTAIAMALH